MGAFPIRKIADYQDRVPEEWARRGGVFLPMYQREAMWLSFSASRPHALKVGVGKVCAISGKPWSETLSKGDQDYLVLPHQPWLDGIADEFYGGVELDATHGWTAHVRITTF